MHEGAGGKIQQEKITIFNWKWKKNGIVEVMINVFINGVDVKCITVFNSVKTLGVCVSPSLSWNDEFEHVKLKFKSSIKS